MGGMFARNAMFGEPHRHHIRPDQHIVHGDNQPRKLVKLGHGCRRIGVVAARQHVPANVQLIGRVHDPGHHGRVMASQEIGGKAAQQPGRRVQAIRHV